jgi:hypothetical protein
MKPTFIAESLRAVVTELTVFCFIATIQTQYNLTVNGASCSIASTEE